ncbi:MAG: ribonuclease P protein component [Acidobacteria bacterium]|nr:MAG: ribonuclease P protein component [Acidobacteriota bacterium]
MGESSWNGPRRASEGFPRQLRIARRSEFRALYDGGRRLHSENFVLFGRENALEHHRLGITVTRKIGGAVVRNRIKRLFREAFRRSRAEIPGHFDFVVNARRDCSRAGFDTLRLEFLSAARGLSRGDRSVREAAARP